MVAGEGWQLGQRPQHWPAQVTAADTPNQPWYHSQGKGKGGTGKGAMQGMKGWGRGTGAGQGWLSGPIPQIESYQSSRQGKLGGVTTHRGKGSGGYPPGGRGYVATLPTCGPLLILPPARKRWGPPRWQGLCSHLAHLWATSVSAPRSKAVGTPQAAGVM